MKHWLYFKYVVRHKWYVFHAGRRRGVGLWQLLVHDWSKFLPDEWVPYAEWFYGNNGGSWHPMLKSEDQLKKIAAEWKQHDFEQAFLLHLHRNPHHHQYWVLPAYGKKPERAFQIPEKYVKEMLADWDGAGRAINGVYDTPAWYEKNKDNMVLHFATREWIAGIV